MHYDLVHGLGTTPRWWGAFLSFDRYGTQEDGGEIAPASGNQAVLVKADDTVLTIANDSCADYWLLVTATASGQPVTPP
jgi:hypothetical protein